MGVWGGLRVETSRFAALKQQWRVPWWCSITIGVHAGAQMPRVRALPAVRADPPSTPAPARRCVAQQHNQFNVRVAVRERPLQPGQAPIAEPQMPPATADFIAGSCDQHEAAQAIGLDSLVDQFVAGEDCTLLAYGQTGSGKTHSMLGPPGALTEAVLQDAAEGADPVPTSWGLWPRAVVGVLRRLEELGELGISSLHVWAVEVYFDNLYDLLHDKRAVALTARGISGKGSAYIHNSTAQYDANGKWIPPLKTTKTAPSDDVRVQGQRECPIRTLSDIIAVGRAVEISRVAQSHHLNHRSSRSHAVIGLKLTRASSQRGTSRFLFVDLAGSERVKKSGVGGLGMAEAVATNKSLSALLRVISSLATGDPPVVPYRDSALTHLLKQSLGGNSCTSVVVTVSPAEVHHDETRNSLRFARQCAQVKNFLASGRRGPTRTTVAEQLTASLSIARAELASLARDPRHAGGIDKSAAESAKRSWLHNKQMLEEYRSRASVAKQQLLESQVAGDNDGAQAAQRDLEHCRRKVTLHEGVVARMMLSGLYKNPSALMVKKQQQVAEIAQQLADVAVR